MKRLTAKILTIAACAAMMLSVGPIANTQSVQAAVKAQGTVNLETKKLSIPKGSTTVLKNNTLTMVKGRRYAVKFKINGKAYSLATLPTTVGKAKVNTTAIASIKNNLLTANKAGTTTFRVVKGSKNLVTLKVKVIDTTAHKHTWKTLTKSTCTTKGKKLCKTCGGTGTTAVSKTHSFKITKRATCETKGVQTCTVCGTKEAIAKTPHKYVTETWKGIEGRGKAYYVLTKFCGACNADMTNWTMDQQSAHGWNLDSDCYGANVHGGDGVERFPKYVMVKLVETYCEHCGAGKDKTKTDLYYVDAKGNKIGADEDPWEVNSYENCCKEHGFVLCENCHLEVLPGHMCYMCGTVAPTTTSATASVRKAAARAVASPQDVITDIPDNTAVEDANVIISADETVSADAVVEDIISANTVSEDSVAEQTISENTVSENSLSENETVTDNTDITDPDQGSDVVFGDPADEDGIVIENTGDSDGIIIETVEDNDANDDTDIIIEELEDSDNNQDNYDGSEGEVTEDE